MKKLEKKDLKKGFWYWQFFAMSTLSFERLEANGFAHSMIPIAKSLYEPGSDEYKALLARHALFYNTEPQTGAIVNGIIVSLEEERANGANVSDDMIHSIKTSLMGPIAGIGDSMVQGVLIPILLSIGMGISSAGSPLGVLFYMVSYLVIMLSLNYFLYMRGYKLGTAAADVLVGDNSDKLRNAFNIMGTLVVGGLAASFVKLATAIEIVNETTGTVFNVQETLDGVFPGLLGLLAVLMSFYLIRKKGWNSNKVLLFLIALATVGVLLGIF